MVAAAPPVERIVLDLIRSIVGHADGHEVDAIAKIRATLATGAGVYVEACHPPLMGPGAYCPECGAYNPGPVA